MVSDEIDSRPGGKGSTAAASARGRTSGERVATGGAVAEPGPSFDEGMRLLDTIVAKLEQGSLPLEQALVEFESGVHLLRRLHEKLGEVEQRVEVLLRDADGVLRVRDGGDLGR